MRRRLLLKLVDALGFLHLNRWQERLLDRLYPSDMEVRFD